MTPPDPGARRFAFRFASRYQRPAAWFGVRPDNAWVDVNATNLDARYGRWRVVTPLTNITGAQITGPYRYLKTAGPARLGVTDLSLSFTSNGERGVEISFGEPVAGIEPLGVLRHRMLTVTVDEPDSLLALLQERAPS